MSDASHYAKGLESNAHFDQQPGTPARDLGEAEIGNGKIRLVPQAPQANQPTGQAGDDEVIPQPLHIVCIADVGWGARDGVRRISEAPQQDA